MSQKLSFLEGVYAHFFLHDLYGKVVPGGIVLLSAALAKDPTLSNLEAILGKKYSWGWFFLIGLAWIIGISLQVVTKHWIEKYENEKKRYLLKIQSLRIANEHERAQLQRYDLVIDASSNGSKAFFLSFIFFIAMNINNICTFAAEHWWVFATTLAMGTSLMFLSKSYKKKIYHFREAILDLNNSDASEHKKVK